MAPQLAAQTIASYQQELQNHKDWLTLRGFSVALPDGMSSCKTWNKLSMIVGGNRNESRPTFRPEGSEESSSS
ncbi:MAG TPA: hypothetical protein VH593_20660 [Ktedonobacteraceae bacterium]